MAISTNGTVLTRLAGSLYNTQMSNATYKEVASLDPAALANVLYARDFSTVSDATVASTIVTNLGLSAVEGLSGWVAGQLTAAGANKGAKVVELLNGFAQMTSDPTYGAAASAFNAKVDGALALSQTTDNAGGVFSSVSTTVTGKTFTLTADPDDLVGGSGNDTFNARADGLFDDGDILNGGSGADRLNFRLDAADQTIFATDLQSIETVYVRVDTTGSFTFDLDENASITSVWAERSAQTTGDAITFTNLVEGTEVGILGGNGLQDIFVVQKDAGVAGASSDAQTIRVNDASADVVDIDNVETINLISEGATSSIAELSAGTADTVSITAGGDVAITLLSVDEDAVVNISGGSRVTISDVGEAITLNAANATGVVTLRGLNEAEAYVVTGGSGNDVFEATGGTALATGDAINGGEGTDLLIVDFDVNAANSFAGISNVERLQFIVGTGANAGAEAAFDMDRITAITSVEIGERTLSATADLDLAITNYRTNTTVVIGDTDLDELDVTADQDSEAALILTVNANSTAGTDITVNTYEVGSIAITSADPSTADIGTSGSASDITLSDSNDSVTTVTLAATVATTLTVNEGTGVESVDASASTSAVTVTVGRAADIVITGGSANDTFAFGTNLSDNDTVNGGGGIDTLTFTIDTYNDNLDVTSIETITVTELTAATNDSSIDLSDAGVVTLNFVQGGSTATSSNTVTFDNIGTSLTTVILDSNVDMATGGDNIVLDLDRDTTADAITIRLDLDGTRFGGVTATEHAITANDFETVNLTVYLDNTAAASQGYTAAFGDVSLTDATNVTITLSLDATTTSPGEISTANDVVLHIDDLNLASIATVDLDAWVTTHIGLEGTEITADLTDADILTALAGTDAEAAVVTDYGITFDTADSITLILGDQRDGEYSAFDFGSGNTGRDVIQFTNSSDDANNDIGIVVIANAVGVSGNVTRRTVIDLSNYDVADIAELTITPAGDSAAGIAITSNDDDFDGVIILVGFAEAGINESNFIFTS